MSAISDNDRSAISDNDRMAAAVAGLSDDIAALNARFQELQNTPVTAPPLYQALLNDIRQRGGAIAQRLDALDALIPPTRPAPPVG